jgi:hypothetical protein
MAPVYDSRDKEHPVRLRGLRQAIYILDQLEEKGDTEEIAKDFEGDEQLIKIWRSFLLHNHWIEHDELGKFMMTEKGRQWARRLRLEETAVS